jgi:hypothetical protein
MIDDWNKEEVELYAEYSDFVRKYLADNTEIKSVSETPYKVRAKRIEIIDIKKLNDDYRYYYNVNPLKHIFVENVMSFETWKRIVFTTKRRTQRLKQLGI